MYQWNIWKNWSLKIETMIICIYWERTIHNLKQYDCLYTKYYTNPISILKAEMLQKCTFRIWNCSSFSSYDIQLRNPDPTWLSGHSKDFKGKNRLLKVRVSCIFSSKTGKECITDEKQSWVNILKSSKSRAVFLSLCYSV